MASAGVTSEMVVAVKGGCVLLSEMVKENLDLHMFFVGEDMGYFG